MDGTPERWPIFICYRRADGSQAAQRVHGALDGQDVTTPDGRTAELDPYLDTRTPGVSNWTQVHGPYLERARAFIVICTPGTKLREGDDDWVHREIDWWLSNRGVAPILIDPLGEGARYVPDAINARWPDIQRIDLRDADWEGLREPEREQREAELREDIVGALLPSRAAVYEQELEQERRRTEQLRQTARRLRLSLAASVVLVVLAVAAAIIAIQQQQQTEAARILADESRRDAEHEALVSRSRQLAARSAQLIGERRDLALLLGVEAVKASEGLSPTDSLEARAAILSALLTRPRMAFLRRADNVESVAFSPDGATLAASGWDGVTLWDVASSTLMAELPADSLRAMAFSPDGSTLAVGDENGDVRLWDATAQQPIGESLRGHYDDEISDQITDLAFSPDGSSLAASSYNGSVVLWDTQSQERVGRPLIGDGEVVHAVAFSPDGKMLAAGGEAGPALWNVKRDKSAGALELAPETTPVRLDSDRAVVETGRRDLVTGLFSNSTEALAFSPDGKLIASGGDAGYVVFWDAATRKQLGRGLTGHEDTISSLAFSPDGTVLASGSHDGSVMIWDVVRRLRIGQALRGHEGWVEDLAFGPSGLTLASGADDGSVILWSFANRPPASQVLEGHDDGVVGVAFRADGDALVSHGRETVILRDPVEGRVLSQFTLDPASSTALSLDASTIATADCDGVVVWDVANQARSDPVLDGLRECLERVMLSPDGATVVSTDDFGTAYLWDVAHGKPIGELLLEYAEPLAFSPDGSSLVMSDAAGNAVLWDVATLAQIGELADAAEDVVVAAFSPDGAVIATGGYEGSVTLWDGATRAPIGELAEVQDSTVVRVAFSPDSTLLATSNRSGTVNLWDVATRMRVSDPLLGHFGPVSHLAFSPDGSLLVSGGGYPESNSPMLMLWELGQEPIEARACGVANRNLTPSEWQRYFPNQEYRLTCPRLPPGRDDELVEIDPEAERGDT